jgi:hypothetical protein
MLNPHGPLPFSILSWGEVYHERWFIPERKSFESLPSYRGSILELM